jgi:glyoxylase-like metal-dependent hydrolase (beta-lactamase superfamily II)
VSADVRSYDVQAVRYATLHAPRSDLFYRHGAYGEPDAETEMAYWFWLLRDDQHVVVVDTGFDPEVGARRGRTCLLPPVEAMRAFGVEPSSVSHVVVTHLHYDHIGNLHAFPHAELIVPERELEFWAGPFASRQQFAPHVEAEEIEIVRRAAAEGRVRTTDGTEEIVDGVVAISVGGHSPGQQVTVVEGSAGTVVLASDAVHLYEELEQDRPFAVMHDLEQMYAAYDLLNDLARSRDAVVVPGHDPEVFLRHGEDGTEDNNRVAARIA